jgi:L-lactate dehydrogenase complex protein LldF
MKDGIRAHTAKALADANLGGALGRFSEDYVVSRARAYEGIDFDALRATIAERKRYAANNVEKLAGEFQRRAVALGARVFRAGDAAAARDYILKLARERGVKLVVKSKSMASEEIHLNRHLQQAGMTVKETDLGEWIIQLAGQKPSHMVLPAIHLTREQVADLFSKEIHERLTTDIPRLVKVARNELRHFYLEADMGLSGANFAVAEGGTVGLVTNEGNARLVALLPKLHVILVGLEKLVATYDDAIPILQALPRSATSQLMTSYVSLISGPVPNTDGTLKELHIILLDNGRTAMARDAQFREAFQCIRCAACLNVCPVYRLVGGHVFGHVYTGGIGTILTAWFHGMKEAEDIQSLCIGCGRCRDVCPGRIDIPGLIAETRRRIVKGKGLPFIQKGVYSLVSHRRAFHALLRAASLAQKPFVKGGMIRHLPLFLSGLVESRSLPAIAAVPFRDRFPALKQPAGTEKAVFFSGCAIDFAYPEIGEAVVRVLNKAGIEVLFPEGQGCCGMPALGAGERELAADSAAANLEALLQDGVRYVVTACASCMAALKRDYPELLDREGRTDVIEKARSLAEKTYDFSSLVLKLLDEGRLKLGKEAKRGKVTYHDSCHAKRSLGISKEPREVLARAGYELVEMFEHDVCCGMGGAYTLKQPEISARILQRKLKNIQATGAGTVAMECPGCFMQIQGGLDKTDIPARAKHTAELIADALAEEEA